MADSPSPNRDQGYLFALAQTGVEMVVPIAVGAYLDGRLGWSPWCSAVGAVLGLAGGLTHMLILIKRHEERRPEPPRDTK